MLRTLALIPAGGETPALSALTAERSEAAVPFAGKYRIIDFTLSNCVNSGMVVSVRPLPIPLEMLPFMVDVPEPLMVRFEPALSVRGPTLKIPSFTIE